MTQLQMVAEPAGARSWLQRLQCAIGVTRVADVTHQAVTGPDGQQRHERIELATVGDL